MKRDKVLSFSVLFARLPSILRIAATVMFACFALTPVFAAMSDQAPLATPGPASETNIPAKGPDIPPPPTIVSNPYAPPKRSAKSPLTRASDMRFAIVRSATSTCEPSCPEWISAYGTIKPDTPSKLRKVLQKLGKRRLPIVIDSNGGAVLAAMEMGRLIRERGLITAVGFTNYSGCGPDQEGCRPNYPDGAYAGFVYPVWAYCMSACPYVLAGGVKRLVGTSSQIGIHQMTTTVTQSMVRYQTRYRIVNGKKKIIDKKIIGREPTRTYTTTKLSRDTRRQLNAYLTGMGAESSLLERMLTVPASDMLMLTYDEALKFKLVSGPGDVMDFATPTQCDQNPKPDNCIELKRKAPKA